MFMGDDFEHHGVVLPGLIAVRKRFVEASFHHADSRFDLPSLSVAALLERPLKATRHLPAMATGWRRITTIAVAAGAADYGNKMKNAHDGCDI